MPTPSTPWFPAKTHGWGWGPPQTWQGWLVLLLYVLTITGLTVLVPPDRYLGGYLASVAVSSGVLLAICWWKGEKPSWRWGRQDDTKA